MKIMAGDWPEGAQAGLRKSFTGKLEALLLFNGVFAHDAIPREQIERAEIVTEANYQSLAGKAGWAALGGLALGGVGLLAGLIAGGRRSEQLCAVTLKDGRRVLLAGKPKDIQVLVAAGF